jgi:hypothetical protein
MKSFDHTLPARREARITYSDNSFAIVAEGDFVRCAVTGDPIAISQLRYWNVRLQEPYSSAEVSVQRYLQLHGKPLPAFLLAKGSRPVTITT